MDTGNAGCGLNFSSISYFPSGDCINGISEKITNWKGIPTSGCCQNALEVLTKALALNSLVNGGGDLFIKENQWINCNYPFKSQQNSVSIQNCGFLDLYNGSSPCSSIPFSTLKQKPSYRYVFDECASFSPWFDYGCGNCTDAIIRARDQLINDLGAKQNPTDKGICAVAVIVAVAASNLNDQSVLDDFYRCLPALNDKGKTLFMYLPILLLQLQVISGIYSDQSIFIT